MEDFCSTRASNILVFLLFSGTSVSPFFLVWVQGDVCILLILSQAMGQIACESVSREQWQLAQIREFQLLLPAAGQWTSLCTFLLNRLHGTQLSLGSDIFSKYPLSFFLFTPKLPQEILTDCGVFIGDKKYIAIEPSSNLIYSCASTLVIACNKLLVQTTVSCTYKC